MIIQKEHIQAWKKYSSPSPRVYVDVVKISEKDSQKNIWSAGSVRMIWETIAILTLLGTNISPFKGTLKRWCGHELLSGLKLSTQQAFTRSRDIGVLSVVNTNSSHEALKNQIVKCIMYITYIYIYKYQIWIWCKDSKKTKFLWT